MSVIILLLIASLSVSLIFLGAYIWSVRYKQFEDTFSLPRRILFDERTGLQREENSGQFPEWKISVFPKQYIYRKTHTNKFISGWKNSPSIIKRWNGSPMLSCSAVKWHAGRIMDLNCTFLSVNQPGSSRGALWRPIHNNAVIFSNEIFMDI